MENKAHALIAGAFVVVVTVLLALLAIWLTRDNTRRDLYEMSTGETISGLQPQAPVRFRGVPVGKVERIGFDAKAKGNVLIRTSVDRGPPVTKSTFATFAARGGTGLAGPTGAAAVAAPRWCGRPRPWSMPGNRARP